MSMQKQKGFTLVEMAIVLVIIGLLLGGVLKGQELIKSAKVKSQIEQINGIIAGINTYQDKYGALPGDDANAQTNTGNTTTITNGDGNGSFNSVEGDQQIWEDLSAANMLNGYVPAANGRFTNKYGFETFVRSNFAGMSGNVVCTLVSNDVAQQIDRKMDDGNGATGGMRRDNQTAYPTTVGNSWICTAS